MDKKSNDEQNKIGRKNEDDDYTIEIDDDYGK